MLLTPTYNFFQTYFVIPFHKARLDVVLIFIALDIAVTTTFGYIYTNWVVILICIFTSIEISMFTINRVFDFKEDSISQYSERCKNQGTYLFVSIILAIVPLIVLFFNKAPILPFIGLIIIGWMYSIPVWRGRRVKNIFLLKNIWAALITYLSMVIFTYPYLTQEISFQQVTFIYVPLLVIAFTYEILIDIKDIKGDRSASVKTLPNTIGPDNTKIVIWLILASLMIFLQYFRNDIAIASVALLFLASIFVNEKRGLWFYHALFYAQGIIIFGYIFI